MARRSRTAEIATAPRPTLAVTIGTGANALRIVACTGHLAGRRITDEFTRGARVTDTSIALAVAIALTGAEQQSP